MLSALVAASCSVFETSDNGDLDGMWQLQALDTLRTGGTADMRDSLLFLSVQMHLAYLKDYRNQLFKGVFYHFDHTRDSLIITDPYYDNRAAGDVKTEHTDDYLGAFGFEELDQRFGIETLTGKKMVLHYRQYRYHFRKY